MNFIGCCVRLCQDSNQIANIIVTYTKALSELPYYSQKESSFSFHGDLGPGASRKVNDYFRYNGIIVTNARH